MSRGGSDHRLFGGALDGERHPPSLTEAGVGVAMRRRATSTGPDGSGSRDRLPDSVDDLLMPALASSWGANWAVSKARASETAPLFAPSESLQLILNRLQTVIVQHVPEGPRKLAKVELEELYIRLCNLHSSYRKQSDVAQRQAKALSRQKDEIVELKSVITRLNNQLSERTLHAAKQEEELKRAFKFIDEAKHREARTNEHSMVNIKMAELEAEKRMLIMRKQWEAEEEVKRDRFKESVVREFENERSRMVEEFDAHHRNLLGRVTRVVETSKSSPGSGYRSDVAPYGGITPYDSTRMSMGQRQVPIRLDSSLTAHQRPAWSGHQPQTQHMGSAHAPPPPPPPPMAPQHVGALPASAHGAPGMWPLTASSLDLGAPTRVAALPPPTPGYGVATAVGATSAGWGAAAVPTLAPGPGMATHGVTVTPAHAAQAGAGGAHPSSPRRAPATGHVHAAYSHMTMPPLTPGGPRIPAGYGPDPGAPLGYGAGSQPSGQVLVPNAGAASGTRPAAAAPFNATVPAHSHGHMLPGARYPTSTAAAPAAAVSRSGAAAAVPGPASRPPHVPYSAVTSVAATMAPGPVPPLRASGMGVTNDGMAAATAAATATGAGGTPVSPRPAPRELDDHRSVRSHRSDHSHRTAGTAGTAGARGLTAADLGGEEGKGHDGEAPHGHGRRPSSRSSSRGGGATTRRESRAGSRAASEASEAELRASAAEIERGRDSVRSRLASIASDPDGGRTPFSPMRTPTPARATSGGVADHTSGRAQTNGSSHMSALSTGPPGKASVEGLSMMHRYRMSKIETDIRGEALRRRIRDLVSMMGSEGSTGAAAPPPASRA